MRHMIPLPTSRSATSMTMTVGATDDAPLMDINMTPLIDVLLVLLIMLILNLPLATHAINMDVGGKPSNEQRATVTIDIERDGTLYWNDEPVTDMAQLEQFFKATATLPNRTDVRVHPDSRAKYDAVAKVLASAQRNGIVNIGFIGNERFVE